MELETVKISDVGEVVTGKTPPTKNQEYYGEEYPFITPTDMNGSDRFVKPDRYLSYEGYDLQKKVLLPADSTCVVCIGATIGKICLTNEPSFTNQQINSIIPDVDKVDPKFIYYLLSTKAEKIKAIAGGAATPIVNKTTFSNVEVKIPEKHTQQKIASILSAFDDLIENNTRRIAILEEMAQLIYREWFVNFRFPGREGTEFVASPLGEIPEGWEVCNVDDAFEIIGGGTPSTKEPSYWEEGDVVWYRPSDLTGTESMFMTDCTDRITELGLSESSAKLFPPFSVMMTSRATVGVVSINTTEAATNQGFITCIPNSKFPLYYLYHWLKENTDLFIANASGATFNEISKTVFRTLKIIQPNKELVQDFNKLINPFGEMILKLQKQNEVLQQTRDLLLPRLIKGDLNITDWNINQEVAIL